MHELSIVEELVALLEVEQCRHPAAAVSRAVVEVGDLAGVDAAALHSAWVHALRRSTLPPGCRLIVTPVGVTIWCDVCTAERRPRSYRCLRCEVCDAHAARIVRGRELEIVQVELVDAASHPSGPNEDPQAQRHRGA